LNNGGCIQKNPVRIFQQQAFFGLLSQPVFFEKFQTKIQTAHFPYFLAAFAKALRLA
jgi:hypothetical protein